MVVVVAIMVLVVVVVVLLVVVVLGVVAMMMINQLPYVWGPKIIILNSNKTTTWCGSKGGSG